MSIPILAPQQSIGKVCTVCGRETRNCCARCGVRHCLSCLFQMGQAGRCSACTRQAVRQ